MPKLIHYRQRCIGCNACVEIDFEHWRMSKKDGKAVLVHGINKRDVYQLEIRQDEVELSKKVVKACPINIIRVEGI